MGGAGPTLDFKPRGRIELLDMAGTLHGNRQTATPARTGNMEEVERLPPA
jgi:hypothetical protein